MDRETVLVTGGYGYIGSHTVIKLIDAGHHVVVVDNLANCKRSVGGRIDELSSGSHELHVFDVRDYDALSAVFASHDISSVVHFAGLKAVGESVADPLGYYSTNLGSTLTLLRVMAERGVRRLVFSSSATVYGDGLTPPFTEDMPRSATNPYGSTKLMIEQILEDVAATDPAWRIAALRYFNPVGAHPSGRIGEDPSGIPNNLMPFLTQVAVGIRPELQIFGGDYDTPDGTGVRDFIHVEDLADGHLAALDGLSEPFRAWNLGTGRPASVLELVAAFEKASGRSIPYRIVGRRPGDVAASYADPSRAEAELGWKAVKTIDDMCADSWRWQQGHPDGLASASSA